MQMLQKRISEDTVKHSVARWQFVGGKKISSFNFVLMQARRTTKAFDCNSKILQQIF